MRRQASASGFTLIELSIVLVIIGLVIGGVMFGQDMIAVAAMRKAVADIDSLQTMMTTFKAKYNQWPGDARSASSFFPGCANVAEWPAGQFNSCNGNGNDQFDALPEGQIRVFQHLELADMPPFNSHYTAVWGAGATPGTNVPRLQWLDENSYLSSGNASGMSLYLITGVWCYSNSNNGCEPAQAAMIGNNDGLTKIVIAPIRTANGMFWLSSQGGLKGDVARNLDTKYDDGTPTGGRIRAFINYPYGADFCVIAPGTYKGTSSDYCTVAFVVQ